MLSIVAPIVLGCAVLTKGPFYELKQSNKSSLDNILFSINYRIYYDNKVPKGQTSFNKKQIIEICYMPLVEANQVTLLDLY